MSSEEPTEKRRSGAWYLLPIFLTIIGGVIAYFVIKEDDPKKAKNCLYLGIILTAIGIGFTVVSGVILSSEMENSSFFDGDMGNYDEVEEIETSENLTPEELELLHENEINELIEIMPYDYDVFGLDIEYLQLQNKEGDPVTEFNNDETYSIVSKITNTGFVDKNIHYTIVIFNPSIGYEELKSDDVTIHFHSTAIVSKNDVMFTIPGEYEMMVEVVDVDNVEQVLEEFNDSDIPGWRSFSEVVSLKESQ